MPLPPPRRLVADAVDEAVAVVDAVLARPLAELLAPAPRMPRTRAASVVAEGDVADAAEVPMRMPRA